MKAQNELRLNMNLWQGRSDGPRMHHLVKPLNWNEPAEETRASYAFLGFACDEGVRRNQGRVGAKDGPKAIRAALSNLVPPSSFAFFDAGDVECTDGDLESAQERLGDAVTKVCELKMTPIVFGGGHEVALGHYMGLKGAFPKMRIGVINFDAHLDMRPLLEGNKGSSGTPFFQIAQLCEKDATSFHYLCIGVQPFANTKEIVDNANHHRAQIVSADSLRTNPQATMQTIQAFLKSVDAVYLTICLDVFARAFAPGVSAPQALGLFPADISPFIHQIVNSNKIIGLDFAELSPALDKDNMTAQLAACLLLSCIKPEF